ncbi:MAG: glucose-1-phosphate thymidylyltransferase [Pseudomonadota bacterium]
MDELKPEALFQLEGLEGAEIFSGLDLVWEALGLIKAYVLETIKPNVAGLRLSGEVLPRTLVLWRGEVLAEGFEIKPGDATKGEFEVWHKGRRLKEAVVLYAGAALMDEEIELGPGVVVEPGALIKGPTRIGAQTEVRQGAYIRGSCLVGRRAVVGHATEIKNSIMLDGAKAGHFAYLGDSILGREVNLGAGTKLANLKLVHGNVKVKIGKSLLDTGLRKFGAILGDTVETGCNTVTSPGTIMAPGCLVAPNMTVPSGYHPPHTVIRPG